MPSDRRGGDGCKFTCKPLPFKPKKKPFVLRVVEQVEQWFGLGELQLFCGSVKHKAVKSVRIYIFFPHYVSLEA